MSGQLDSDRIARAVTALVQLAERIDRESVEIAFEMVPLEWWAARDAGVGSGG